jgi:protein dithiol oxidoreductase (disulfide-forming)
MLRFIGALILSFTGFAYAADAAVPAGSVVVQASSKYTEGKEYKLLPATASQGPSAKALLDTHKGKVEVIDFFSYGCPVCNRMEPDLEKWANSKKSTQMVAFVDVPVEWDHPGWENLARAFYIAESLDVLPKAHPALFNAVHVQNKNFKNQADLKDFFITQAGVMPAKFDETFDSFTVRRRLKQGQLLREEYGIMAIPSFVINGKYYVDVQTAGGIKQAIEVVDYLVNKESFTKGEEEITFDNVKPKSVPTKVNDLTPSTPAQ